MRVEQKNSLEIARSYCNTGVALFQQGRPAESVQYFQKALEIQPDYVDASFNLGSALGQQGRFQEAIARFQKTIEINPNFTGAHRSLALACFKFGTILIQQNRLDEAIAHFQRTLTISPDYAEAHFYLGTAFSLQHKPEEAIGCFQRTIKLNPDHAEAYGNLGAILLRQGRLEEAVIYLQKAIAIKPDYVEANCNLGAARTRQEKFEEATTLLLRALERSPNYAEAHCNLAVVLTKQDKFAEAAIHCQKALATKPDYAEAHLNLGVALVEQKKLEEAIACFQTALEIQPDYIEAHFNLASALIKQDRVEQAIANYEKVLLEDPDNAEGYANIALVLAKHSKLDEAISFCQKAIAIKSDCPEAHLGLAMALTQKDELDEAISSFQRAIELNPDYGDAYGNLGVVLTWQNRLDEAIAAYTKAITLQAKNATTHLNLGMALLLNGDLQRGWDEYEWRWKVEGMLPPFSQPMWDGSNLSGKTILLWSEQGLGDTLQFVRYIPLVAERSGRVIVQTLSPLAKSLSVVDGIAQIVIAGAPMPEFDVQAPLLNLPRLLGTTLETIPSQIPYLGNTDWRAGDRPELLLPPTADLKVGIVWASGYREDANLMKVYRDKSCAISLFMELLSVPNIQLYSLQVGRNAPDISEFAREPRLHDLSIHIRDFADTAAFIDQLDIVISVDTSTIHLAGAMGKPVWVMLPFAADWRWLLDREDTPWYPTMRLFRQPRPGDWHSVFEQIIQTLNESKDSLCQQVNLQQKEFILKPDLISAESYNFLGDECYQRKEFQQAIAHYRHAVSLKPDFVPARVSLSNALRECGEMEEGIACLRKVLELQPDRAETYCNLADALFQQGKTEETIACCEKALELKPDFAEAYCNLGAALKQQGKLEEAIACYRKAIEIQPEFALAYSNLGSAYFQQNNLEESIACSRKALELKSDFAEAYVNLGSAYIQQNMFEEAIDCYQKAIAIAPNHANAHSYLGIALLLMGDYNQGFVEYEWRWQTRDMHLPDFSQPIWDGSNLGGRTILLWTEQGLGDTLQFVRYIPLVAQLGGRVIVQCPPSLVRLLSTADGISDIVAIGSPLPAFDVHAPLLTLPKILGTTLETIPARIPYLFSSHRSSVVSYQSFTKDEGQRTEGETFKIGIAWASGYRETQNLVKVYKTKSCPPSLFMELLSLPNISLCSLQVGRDATDLKDFAGAPGLHDWSDRIRDFADTAAAIDQLDLVISVDTAIAHLAGAMGKPVWVLLPFAADWRWLRDREDSPWYPTMRLFRQKFPGNWEEVWERVRRSLSSF